MAGRPGPPVTPAPQRGARARGAGGRSPAESRDPSGTADPGKRGAARSPSTATAFPKPHPPLPALRSGVATAPGKAPAPRGLLQWGRRASRRVGPARSQPGGRRLRGAPPSVVEGRSAARPAAPRGPDGGRSAGAGRPPGTRGNLAAERRGARAPGARGWLRAEAVPLENLGSLFICINQQARFGTEKKKKKLLFITNSDILGLPSTDAFCCTTLKKKKKSMYSLPSINRIYFLLKKNSTEKKNINYASGGIIVC